MSEIIDIDLEKELRLVRVHAAQLDTLKEYVEALYRHDEDYDAMVHIENGVKSMLRNEALATAYFIEFGELRIGYFILTRYHSVERGGLTLYIDELYVEETHRRKGVGKRIMARIMDMARGEGAKALSVQAEPYNEAAREFFRSMGFTVNPYVNFERGL